MPLPVDREAPLLAIVLPAFNEEDSLPHAVEKLTAVFASLTSKDQIAADSFILIVDDGSSDQTWEKLSQLAKGNAHVKGLKLSRNFGHQAALMAGLTDVAGKCDAVISMDVDLQQDPNAIPEFLNAYRQGGDVVLGIRQDRSTDGPLKKQSALLFYRLMGIMGVRMEKNHADYRLLSAAALRALMLYPEPDIFLRAVCIDLGFDVKSVYFSVDERKFGATKYSFRKMLSFALSGITSFSTMPLRWVAYTGVIVFMGSIVMALYIFWQSLVMKNAVPGWASTTLPIYFIGGLQLLSLGVIGEYLARVYATVKNRPRWICESRIE